jgi:hypothetical protein
MIAEGDLPLLNKRRRLFPPKGKRKRSVHLAYNPSYSACFFSQNSIFLLKKISQQCFSAGL